MPVSFTKLIRALLALSMVWILNGCSQASKRAVAPPLEQPARITSPTRAADDSTYVHLVRWQGETLSIIAEWYTGSRRNREAIATVNPDVDPGGIEIGDRIRIPERLLKTRAPMPRDFLPAGTGRKALQSAPPRGATGKPSLRPDTEAKQRGATPTTSREDAELFRPSEVEVPATDGLEETDLFRPEQISGKPTMAEEPQLFAPIQ